MSIDIFTPETMDRVVRSMPQRGSFFKDTFFRVEKPEFNETIRVDFYKGKRRLAPFVNLKDKAKVIEKAGYSTDTFTTPMIAMKDVTTIEDMVKRLPGELLQNSGITPLQRGIQLMAQQLADFDDMISRREEWMCAQAMLTGKIPVIGENVNYEIDFGFTNKATVSQQWDTSANPTVYKDLQAAALACMQNGYRKPDICIMERSAYQAFLRATKLDEEFKQQSELYNIVQVKPRYINENLTYVGRIKDPDLEVYVYDEWFIDDWTDPSNPTEKQMMPKGTILLASTRAQFSMYYGLMSFTDPNTNNFRQVVGKRGADTWVQKEPDARFMKLASRPLPVPHEVDSWYVLEVSATA